MNVTPWHELLDFWPFKNMFLADRAIVYVTTKTGKIQKRAYNITPGVTRLLDVYEQPGEYQNPKIHGRFVYDYNNRVNLKWKEGDDYAYPLSSDDQKNTTSKELAERMYHIGYNAGSYDAINPTTQGLLDNPILVGLGIVIIITILNIVMGYLAYDALGVGIFADPDNPIGGVICRNVGDVVG